MPIKLNTASGGGVILQGANTASDKTITIPATDGTVVLVGTSLTQATAVTASGTSVDFTGIPSWAKRVTVMFNGVSTNGSSVPVIQLGSSGAPETSGYVGASAEFGNAATLSVVAYPSNGIAIQGGMAASISLTGFVSIVLQSANTWIANGSVYRVGATNVTTTVGLKSLASTLDRIRITTANGTDAFDAGTINIMYEG